MDELITMLRRRPAWWDRARCRGMGSAFLSHEAEDMARGVGMRRHVRSAREERVANQMAVCWGTAGGDTGPCPVMAECLDDLDRRCKEHGWTELLDGDTVCGGVEPSQQRRVIVALRRKAAE